MLKLTITQEELKRIVLQHYFYRTLPSPPEFNQYESYFLIENGEPSFVIEELT